MKEEKETSINTVYDLLTFLKETVLIIRFRKKDKTLRLMKCTLNEKDIPKSKLPKNTNIKNVVKNINENKIIHVFDIEKNDWRSLPINRIEEIGDGNVSFRYNIK